MSTLFTADNGYEVVRCLDCTLAFTDARKAPHPSELYPPFDQQDGIAQRSARGALGLFLRQRAAVVEARVPHGRLLDYGAGSGSFARYMSGRGFDATGLEPFSLGTTTQEKNLTLVRAPLDSVKDTLGKFDVITLWHVLEHLETPVPVLATLKGMLAPGGVLVTSVPNFGSWQSKLFSGRWFHLDPPRHLLHFEPESLQGTLRRAGLEPIGEVPFMPEYGTSGWIQSALNLVLPHKNFLYEFVKDRGALESMSTPSRLAHFAASVTGSAALFGASIPVEYVASRTNAAAALTVVSRPA
jgi:SAM-dependent methyltransferase